MVTAENRTKLRKLFICTTKSCGIQHHRVLNTPLVTRRDLTDQANVCYCETLFERLTTIFDTKLKRFHGGCFELEMLEIYTGAFLSKIIIIKFFIVAFSSVIRDTRMTLKM